MANIMVVEDESILAMSIKMELEGMGHEVTGVAASGEEALALIEKIRPDLILVDIVIHGDMSGIELTAIVNEKYGIPVLYGTAHTDKATIEKANATKHRGILYKPYQPHELRAAIEKSLLS